jgi:class 3 adenylate cyclase
VLTFLFTDVVDSTVLWERAPGLMDGALSRHDKLIESSVTAHGGIVLKHRGEGDSTFCVFERAADAVAAAVGAQRDIATAVWDAATPISVRMGIHSGESILRGRDYYGRTINRAARVRAIAEGGQVLLSSAASELVGDDLPDDTELRFIRQEVLRGIGRAESIHELVDLRRRRDDRAERIEQPRPPVQREITAGVHRAFAGRDESMALIDTLRSQALPYGPPQLVLLDGEPGIGKTTLACAAAARSHDDGWTALLGTCTEHINAPFEPFRDILDHLVDVTPMHVLAAHLTEHGGEVGRLTQRLGARVGALPPIDALDPETTRQLLIDAVVDLLLRAADDRPLLLVVDSIHWADRSTLSVLDRLMRMTGHPVVVIGANETRERGGVDGSALLADLRVMPTSTTIEVQPFA